MFQGIDEYDVRLSSDGSHNRDAETPLLPQAIDFTDPDRNHGRALVIVRSCASRAVSTMRNKGEESGLVDLMWQGAIRQHDERRVR